MYYNPETKALRTIKKAQYRHIDEPVGIYKYIIYSRLDMDRIPFYNERVEYAKDYLEDKVDKKYIGYKLGSKLANDLAMAEKRLQELKSESVALETWKKVKNVLDDNKVLPWRWWDTDNDDWILELDQLLKGKCSPKEIEYAIADAQRLINRLERMQVENDKS